MRDHSARALGVLATLLLLSCGQPPAADTSEPEAPATIATVWPASLRVMGDGFPRSGDPCRRLGESAATVDFLDDSAQLVGCPGSATAPETAAIVATLGGRVVGTVDGVTLVTVPQGDANAGMPEASETTTGNSDKGNTEQ